jgi:hypothetical protein
VLQSCIKVYVFPKNIIQSYGILHVFVILVALEPLKVWVFVQIHFDESAGALVKTEFIEQWQTSWAL